MFATRVHVSYSATARVVGDMVSHCGSQAEQDACSAGQEEGKHGQTSESAERIDRQRSAKNSSSKDSHSVSWFGISPSLRRGRGLIAARHGTKRADHSHLLHSVRSQLINASHPSPSPKSPLSHVGDHLDKKGDGGVHALFSFGRPPPSKIATDPPPSPEFGELECDRYGRGTAPTIAVACQRTARERRYY